MNGRVSRAEWRWVLAVTLLVVVASTLPYAVGYLAQNDEMRFAGAVFNLSDYHSHLAKMQQGYRGEWRYRLLFTPQEHEGAYLQTFYVALGHLARLLGLSLPLTYHLARLAGGLLLLPAVYRFVALFAAPPLRRVIFLLAATSSGLGWLVGMIWPAGPGGISPIDFWLIDAYLFFSLFTFPHFAVAVALLLTIYTTLLPLAEERGPLPPLKSGAAVLLSWGLGLIHPYALLLADLVPGLYLLWVVFTTRRLPTRLLATLLLMGVTQLPLLLYDYQVFATVPVFHAWSAQNLTLSPPPLYYLLGYGLVALLAVWGVRPAWRAAEGTPFLLLWVVTVFVLAYLPWGLQRRFVEGVHVPLCILAGYGLTEGLMGALARPLGRLARRLRYNPRRLRWLVQATVIALASLSNLYLLTTFTLAAAARHPALFHRADEVAVVEWLASNATWDETVLAAEESGNWIAAATGQRVVLGHWAETVDYAAQRERVASFYAAAAPDEERCALLAAWGVVYVYAGPAERELGAAHLDTLPCLEPLLQRGQVTLYRREVSQ